MTKMIFDPYTCGYDRPGEVYGDGVRIYKRSEGQFVWCRSATPEEVLWIASYEQADRIERLLTTLVQTQAYAGP